MSLIKQPFTQEETTTNGRHSNITTDATKQTSA
jgi:hypothetical protein